MKLSTVVQADVKLTSGRVYPRAVLEAAVEEIKTCARERRLLGEYHRPDEYSESAKIHLDRVSHLVTDIWIEGGALMVEIEIMDTERGREVKEKILSLVAFPRGIGDVGEDLTVLPGYRITAVDLSERHCTLTQEELDKLNDSSTFRI